MTTRRDLRKYLQTCHEVGLGAYAPAMGQDGILLKILPLREDAPIYFTDRSTLKFGDAHTALSGRC
jgi:hypothetical protein